ncbi:AsmA protein [Sphingomonas sp. HMP6]|nr:AsmA protein [Sphingomonas sp. HMP6]
MDTTADVTPAAPPPLAPPPARKRLSRPWRIARNVVIGVVLALFLVWLVLYITKGRFLKGTFERVASAQTERTVSVAGDFQLYFDPITIHFRAEGLRVSNPEWTSKPDLYAAKAIDARIAPLSMLFGKRRLYTLDLVDSAVDLEWNKAHTQNSWTSARRPAASRSICRESTWPR